MTTAALPRIERSSSLSPADIQNLARTFDEAAAPVWVHDLAGDCVYCNPTAHRSIPHVEDTVFEISNGDGLRVGHLRFRDCA